MVRPTAIVVVAILSVLVASQKQIRGQQDGQVVERPPTVNEILDMIITRVRELGRRIEVLESEVTKLGSEKKPAQQAPPPVDNSKEVDTLKTELATLKEKLDELTTEKAVESGIDKRQAEMPIPGVPNIIANIADQRHRQPLVGEIGPRGEQGLQGEKGLRGERGPQGPQGQPGAKGITQIQLIVEPKKDVDVTKLPLVFVTSTNFCGGCPDVAKAVEKFNAVAPGGRVIQTINVDAYMPSSPSGSLVFVGPIIKDFETGETVTGKDACIGVINTMTMFVDQ